MLKTMVFSRRLTNHSVRKTCISKLLDTDIPVICVAQLGGHQNQKSRDSYKSASILHWRRMSFSSHSANVRATCTSTSYLYFSCRHSPKKTVLVVDRKCSVEHIPWSKVWNLLFWIMNSPVTSIWPPKKKETRRKHQKSLFIRWS